MLIVEDLRKVYGDFVAVRGATFQVDAGEIFGVVGPNGAGKTTTLKMLAGLVDPTAGTATVAGYDVDDPAMRHHLGFLPEESPLYENMTARSYLRFFADLYEVDRDTADERIESTLDRLELAHRDRRLGDVSKGMKRKVAIARSLVNDPDVLVYDEPASGLDPLTTNEVLSFIRELAGAGKTVLFSAHNLYHVESVCDRVVVMHEGKLIARGTVPEIRAAHGGTEYRVFTSVAVEGATTDAVDGDEKPADDIAGHDPTVDGVDDDHVAGERYQVTVASMEEVEEVRERAAAAGGEVLDIRTSEPTLEEIFLDLTGEPMAGSRRVGGDPTGGERDA